MRYSLRKDMDIDLVWEEFFLIPTIMIDKCGKCVGVLFAFMWIQISFCYSIVDNDAVMKDVKKTK